jgi:hypothetical protein
MRFWFLALLTTVGWLNISEAFADIPVTHRLSSCPKDQETLVSLLLKDLPSYTNRVIQRNRKFKDTLSLYILLAGRPEFEPLKLSNQQYQPLFTDTTKQVFFTTLERQYLGNRAVKTENYHWLFLTPTNEGWKMVMLFSRFGSADKNQPSTPPIEANNSMVGQAIKLWLRDCFF